MTHLDLIAFAPELLMAVAILTFILFGAFTGDKAARPVAIAGIVVMLVAAFLVANQGTDDGTYFNNLVAVNDFTGAAKILILLVSAGSLFLALPHIARDINKRFEFPLLYLFATLGMMILVSAQDLMTLYLGLELMSLSLYVLAALRRELVRASEAGLKYFVLGALSSGMILYGSSIIYGYSGATNFDLIAGALTESDGNNIGLLIGLVFVVAGLAFKVSAVPFHMWTPDVYQGAPAAVTAFFAGAPKLAAMMVFVRVLVEPFGDLTAQWQQVIALIAMASMILGAFAALNQRNIKRLMAYSSIANMGYALIGLAAGTPEGVQGLMAYMTIYAVMTLGSFAVIMLMRREDRPLENIEDLAGLINQKPRMAAAMIIMMFSLSGIPPLAGFFGKLMVFMAAINQGSALMLVVAIVGALTSVIAAFYYLRIIKLMVFDPQADELDHKDAGEWSITAGVAAALLIVLTLGFNHLHGWFAGASAVLFAG